MSLPTNGKRRGWCVMASCALSILLCMQDTDHWGTMRNLHVGQIHMVGGFFFVYTYCYIDFNPLDVYELRSKNDILINSL